YLSGLSLISLLATLSDITPIKDSLSSLQARQLADGSWRNEAYTTAVVIRALTLAQLRAGSTQPPSNGTGALAGHVYKAGSEEPIADATIDVTNVPGLSVKTNAAGYFIVSGLAPGNASLTASKAGFGTASAVAKVATGQVTSVSGLVL
ncbi:MAG: carboxypeptidase-like regulatory domain-containing protein, partial [Longimicrobiales bacterium]